MSDKVPDSSEEPIGFCERCALPIPLKYMVHQPHDEYFCGRVCNVFRYLISYVGPPGTPISFTKVYTLPKPVTEKEEVMALVADEQSQIKIRDEKGVVIGATVSLAISGFVLLWAGREPSKKAS